MHQKEENHASCIPDLKYVGVGVEKSSFTEYDPVS